MRSTLSRGELIALVRRRYENDACFLLSALLLCGLAASDEWRIFLGVSSGEGTPGPISNPVVKLSSADGTWRVTAWERRSSPSLYSSLISASQPSFFAFASRSSFFPPFLNV